MTTRKPHRASKAPRIKMTKIKTCCDFCKKKETPDRLFSKVDGNNYSITLHAPALCLECCQKKYKNE